MGTSSPTKERMIEGARALIRRRGVAGTSMLDVLAETGSPRGSFYHHFPGGKAELVEEATRAAIADYAAGLDYVARLDPMQAIPLVIEVWRREAEESHFTAGCPVAAAALGGEHVPAARKLAGRAFGHWTDALEQMLRNASVPDDRARALSTLILASVQGAVVLSLAQHSTAPMDQVADQLVALVATSKESD